MKEATKASRGRGDELRRRAELPQPALDEDADLVGERGRVLVVVRHEQRRQRELPQQLRELVPHLGLRVRVERRERLVEEEHPRIAGERPRERDPLPLASRELVRMRRREVRDAEALEQRVDVAAARAEGDVRAHAQVREEGVVLEHEADAAPLGREREPALGVEPRAHRPGTRGREAARRGRRSTRRTDVLPAPDGPTSATVRETSSASSSAKARRGSVKSAWRVAIGG